MALGTVETTKQAPTTDLTDGAFGSCTINGMNYRALISEHAKNHPNCVYFVAQQKEDFVATAFEQQMNVTLVGTIKDLGQYAIFTPPIYLGTVDTLNNEVDSGNWKKKLADAGYPKKAADAVEAYLKRLSGTEGA